MSPPEPRGDYLLVLRRSGVWAIANGSVLEVRGAADGYRIRLGGDSGVEDLVVDEVLGVVEDLKVSPAGTVIERFWPQPAAGLAVHGGTPLVVIDPRRPPQVMILEQGEASDVDGRADAS